MKASKIFIKWIIISLVFQFALYLYLDRFYFSSGDNLKVTEAKSVYKAKQIKPNVTIPHGADNISLSSDCRYTAYFDNGIVKVVDTNTGKGRKLSFGGGVQCLSYKWISDSNRMIIAEKIKSSVSRSIRFYSYDAENQLKEEIKDYNTEKVDSIPVGVGENQVSMAMSTLTGVMYAKISYANGLSSIYRIDANETMTKINTVVKKIGKIGVASRDDQLVYEDATNSRVRTNTSCRVIDINGNLQFSLLGTDDDNNIYVGNKIGKINKICYGKLAESQNLWKIVNLNSSYDAENLKIIGDGKIYFVDENHGRITNVRNENYCTYDGNFIGIYDGKIASVSDSKLLLKNIN
ncbi:hypothetical protein [Clostridium guangxiense]|uniref:hypothetical protein n=1 Tax=Clostridium guangxiense TaxID=1662055 RepID=UPI001E300898|nr:hypothetical protein [Clostridium guangxiense]MCD2347284.1 hypothetical protein [Clostridium guangxiense]